MSDTQIDGIFKKDIELVYDKNYIQSVYKRTERISSACFYIADKIEDTYKTQPNPLPKKIYDVAANVLDISAQTLSQSHSSVRSSLVTLTAELIRLASCIHMAAASERVPVSHAMAIQFEIDAVIGTLDQVRARESESRHRMTVRERRRSSASQNDGVGYPVSVAAPSEAHDMSSDVRDRKDKIKDILREKGQVGIKDISDVIKDVSEKSIQRDLNDLIESGAVVRIGERRWSTYRLS
jgi:hypothetical protein